MILKAWKRGLHTDVLLGLLQFFPPSCHRSGVPQEIINEMEMWIREIYHGIGSQGDQQFWSVWGEGTGRDRARDEAVVVPSLKRVVPLYSHVTRQWKENNPWMKATSAKAFPKKGLRALDWTVFSAVRGSDLSVLTRDLVGTKQHSWHWILQIFIKYLLCINYDS